MQKGTHTAPSLDHAKQWLPIGISLAALLLSLLNTSAAFKQNHLEEIFRPLHFTVSRGAQSVVYRISDADGSPLHEIPGYETTFSCKTGAYLEFSQIYYDGSDLELAFADMDVLESGAYVIQAKGQIPSADHIPGEKIYDYCFVRTVAASGERELWLIYYVLDLEQNTVEGPFKANDTILLLLQNEEEESSKRTMLQNYQKLYEMVDTLPGS